METERMRVGVVGLGGMGAGMAGRLLDTGWPVCVFNRTTDRVRPLEEAGAAAASSPAEVARASDVVLVCVSDEQAAEAVLFGRHGVLGGSAPGTLVADCTTTSSAFARRLAARAASCDVSAVDLGVLGNPFHARTGESRIVVGTSEESYRAIAPILADLARDVRLIGPNGAASTMKLALNIMMGAQMAALAEAVTLAESHGIERGEVLDILGSGGYCSPMLAFRCGVVRSGRYHPAAFRTSLMAKDMDLGVSEAISVRVPAPISAAITTRLYEAVSSGVGDLDVAAVVGLAELEAGLDDTWPADIKLPIALHTRRAS